jgi:hypothetical protein
MQTLCVLEILSSIVHSPMQPNTAFTKNAIGDILSHYFLFYILHGFSIYWYLQLLPAIVQMAIQRKKFGKRNHWKLTSEELGPLIPIIVKSHFY